MIRIGEITGAATPETITAPACPGAMILINGKDYEDMTRAGEVFSSSKREIPPDGYGRMRLFCQNVCERVPQMQSELVQFYGLCSSCTASEKNNRATLRFRQSAKPVPR